MDCGRAIRAAAGAAAMALAAGACSSGSAAPSGSGSGQAPVNPTAAAGLQQGFEAVVQSTLPSIVQINTATGLGSGVVLDDSGDIITNAHVVGSATAFKVSLATGGAPLTAHLLSAFPQGDLAVIKLDNPPADLKPAAFADSSTLEVGQVVLAMGNPLGLSGSVTDGIVSATGRTVTEPGSGSAPAATLTDMIQTSASINPGNSGGALVDLGGRVVGIPTLAAADQPAGGQAPGIGFAISANTAKDIADQIISEGKVTDSGIASLDLVGSTVVDGTGQPVGVGVVSLTANGAADKAGIAVGAVIAGVNGSPTPTVAMLSQVLAGLKPGQPVPVQVLNDGAGTTSTVTVTLGTLPVQ
jgi:putative serine protease PepD